MNAQAQAYNVYKKTSVETVAPGKLLLMLYDGAMKYLKNAQKAIGEKDFSEAHNQIIRVQDIITELMSTLNMDYEISNSLLSLYDYIYRRLVEANVAKDKVILEEVYQLLTELRDTWNQVINQTRSRIQPTPASGLNVRG
ncbi:flagellar export chaperone FliS [Syntrophomonas erecta]